MYEDIELGAGTVASDSNSNLLSLHLLLLLTDMCLGGETRNPEGLVKKLVEKGNLDGVALEATFYYIINVSWTL